MRSKNGTFAFSGGSRPGVWGGQSNRGRQNVFTCRIPLVLCDNRWLSHKRGYLLLLAKKVGIFVGRTLQSFMESQ